MGQGGAGGEHQTGIDPIDDPESVPVRKLEIEQAEIDLGMLTNYIVSWLSDASKTAASLSSSFNAPRDVLAEET
jgi:hypothetical protein